MINKNLHFFLAIKPGGESQYYASIHNLIDWLKRKGVEVLTHQKYLNKIEEPAHSNLEKKLKVIDSVNDESIDFYISLGGDGTLIGLCRKIESQKPIIGINLGKLGFITEFNAIEMFDILEKILNDQFHTKKITTFTAQVKRNGQTVFEFHFLNDAVISKSNIARMFEVSIETDASSIFNLAGDGVIFSSPVGSTAYSLAAGGPIVHPGVQGLVITPICPHGLTHRPIVLSDDSKIRASLLYRDQEISLTIDGQKVFPIKFGDDVLIQKNEHHHLVFVENKDKDYFFTLKEKFFLSRRNS